MIRKALVVPESVTLAHVIRAVSVGLELQRKGVEVHYAFDSHFDAPLKSLFPASFDLPRTRIRTLQPAEFNRRIGDERFPYTLSELNAYVEEELGLMRDLRPDVVIGDFRLSLLISARLSGIQYWNLANAHWSRDLDLQYPIQGTRLGGLVPRRISTAISSRIFRGLGSVFDEALVTHGMEPLRDLRAVYTAGDQVLYADPSGWVPLRGSQDDGRRKFIGPIEFTPATPLPPWWEEAMASRNLALVNLGSSGASGLVLEIAVELRKMGFDVVASGVKDLPARLSDEGIRSAPLLPTSRLVSRARVFVCNGGAPNIYLALAEACPVLGVISNYDQALAMSVAEWNGVGRYLWAEQCSPSRLRRNLTRLLETVSLGSRLKLAQERVRSADYRASIADLLAAGSMQK